MGLASSVPNSHRRSSRRKPGPRPGLGAGLRRHERGGWGRACDFSAFPPPSRQWPATSGRPENRSKVSRGQPLLHPDRVPFLPTLADALLDGTLVGPRGPDDLAGATIYLPTRRAGRAFADLLTSRRRAGRCLPRIVPLGDADEERPGARRRRCRPRSRRSSGGSSWPGSSRAGRRRPSRAGGRPRRLAVMPARRTRSALAADLDGLMDALATEGVDWDDLAGSSMRSTRPISRRPSPSCGSPTRTGRRSSPSGARATRRGGVTRRCSPRRSGCPDRPAGPVIAAGSTGSVPATAQLLSAIARLPHGAVVLPGLDTDLDEAAWRRSAVARRRERRAALAIRNA